MITADESGTLEFGATSDGDPYWTFTPTNAETMLMAADGDYLYYGLWLSKPTTAGMPHMFAAFAGSGDKAFTMETVLNLTALAGKARYMGTAAGKYVLRNQVDLAEIGIFTADAELEADFGTGDEDTAILQGAITNFMSGDTELTGWSVSLLPDVDGDDNIERAADTPFAVTASGPVSAQIGGLEILSAAGGTDNNAWNAGLYGNSRKDDHPASVAGTFNVFSHNPALVAGTPPTPLGLGWLSPFPVPLVPRTAGGGVIRTPVTARTKCTGGPPLTLAEAWASCAFLEYPGT